MEVPGEVKLPGWSVSATYIDRDQAELDERWIKDRGIHLSEFVAHLDSDVIDDKLIVRGRRRGDRFQPLGMSQLKKIQDFMVDARIPQAWRDGIPLVCSHKQILWVVGWRIDDRTKITRGTRRITRLEFQMVS